MGTYLIALIEYPGLTERVSDVLTQLENYPTQQALQGFDIPPSTDEYSSETEHAEWQWTFRPVLPNTHPVRPVLPSLSDSLYLPENYHLMFRSDVIQVHFGKKWQWFLGESQGQQWIIGQLTALCTAFEASDCIISHDYHAIDDGFFDELPFSEILKAGPQYQAGPPNAEGYYDLNLSKAVSPTGEWTSWEENKEVPDGWKLLTMWDCYWRLPMFQQTKTT